MKSDICRIENGTRDLEAILKESERVAEYNGLSHKQALRLRLLCEEMDGMLPNIIDDFDGDFWIEYNEGVCRINAEIKIHEITGTKKSELISVAKNKKNAAAVGIVGKIRNAIENYFISEETSIAVEAAAGSISFSTGFSDGVDYSAVWTLEKYRNAVNRDEQAEEWDELEKSVIASASDDVIVGVKGRQATITIVKKFA